MPAQTTHKARIASHTPGRLRVKVARGKPDAAAMRRIKAGLEARPGIAGVGVNPANGSITVHYDPKHHSTAGILGVLEDVDVLVDSLTDIPGLETQALTVGEAIGDLNARLSRRVGWPIDLRVVLPLLFVGAGTWSILRHGLMLGKVPGWMLLWLGFDLFVKTHPPDRAGTARPADTGET